ncbi:MAG: GNAT family N-acetyltransferase [Pseudomonadota bacterium]
MTVSIKMAAPSDIGALQKIVEQTGLFSADMLPDMIQPFLSAEDASFWLVAEDSESQIGFCYVVPEQMADGTWNMLALGVLPKSQGKGVGGLIVTAAEDHLREQSQRILIVDTSGTEDFAQARNFYAKMGYDQEARIRDYWAEGDDKVTFRKSLRD